MAESMTIYEKPTSHLSPQDWYAKQWELQQSMNSLISDAVEVRNTARTLRNETKIRTEWDTFMNNSRLEDRVKEISQWKDVFETLLNDLAVEKNLLREARSEAENDLENIQHPLQVTAQCISMRDCRRGTELTYDEADTELKKELRVIESMRKPLTEKVQAAWEKLNKLEEVTFQVNLEFEDKRDALEIDKDNANLNRNSAGISYKPNALRIPKNAHTYESWIEHCRCIKSLAESEMSDTHNFRDMMNVMRKRARNDIEAQQDATDFALRKRIYQTQKAKNDMDWETKTTEQEMELLLKEIRRLEDALRHKTDAVKCAETRLENRTYRPGYELCRDEAEFGLRDEVLQLRQTKEELKAKIDCAKATYNALEPLLIRIKRNLDDKQHSMTTDVMCLDMRSTIKTGDRARLSNETDRNIALTHLENEIPFES
ncbi:hypothetical protein PV327_001894 [Microctonus hyperodae]|uniref:Tektin n=1 Tax=Microctonus hyperodae TaxID=165561 RepID=A0AA39KNI8_MICHY|nr:hypothetical protein PV327_001894 [Microctonus hyperodae]